MDRDPKMVPLNRVTRLCALTLTMLMSLAAARAQGPPEGSGLGASCPEPMGNFFGHFVMTDAIAFVAGRNREEKKEKTCWVAGPSASGQNRVESQSGEDAMAAEYSYTISAAGISAAAKVSGQHNSDHGGGGSGVSMLWLMWHDTLTFHSSQIPLVDPNDYRGGHPPTPEQLVEQMIHFKVKLLQSPPQCSGLKEPEFHYLTAVAAVVVDIGGGKGIIAPGGAPPGATSENWLLRADTCGIPASSVTAQVPNGQSVAVHITVQENLLGNTNEKTRAGNLKVDLSAERLCVVRPAKPSDLTITAASGGDYWCP
jgi:hypothetical protein